MTLKEKGRIKMLKPIDINKIPNRTARKSPNGTIMKEIEQFLKSAGLAAEVIVPRGRSANSICASYRNAIRAKSYPVNCIRRKDRVFLIAEKEAKEAAK